MRKYLCILCALVVALSLCGCSAITNLLHQNEEPEPAPAPSENIQVGVPEEDISFDLEEPQAPVFSEQDQEAPPADEDLYIERDGYAYKLDPATLEPIDIPLDPVTKEPIEAVDVLDDAAPVPEDIIEMPEFPVTAVEPTEEIKYPNTGIFLEDD